MRDQLELLVSGGRGDTLARLVALAVAFAVLLA